MFFKSFSVPTALWLEYVLIGSEKSTFLTLKDDTYVTKRVMNMHVYGWKGREKSKTRWMHCVRNDTKEIGVNIMP